MSKLEETFPKLKGCGGIELLRTTAYSRCQLQLIKPGPNGYTTDFLANSYLGQAICFVRPIQMDLDISPLEDECVSLIYIKWLKSENYIVVFSTCIHLH
jgi:hypothetical protein